MKFKRHKWMEYGRRGKIIEIKIKDESDMLLDTFKCNNPKAFKTIAKILKEKYGFDFSPEISTEDSINTLQELQVEKDWFDKIRK